MAQSRRRDAGGLREGIMLLELLFATGFLALACGIAVKMHRSRLDYDRAAMNRLRGQLEIENQAQHLSSISFDDILGEAKSIGASSDVVVEVEEFWSDKTIGLHLTLYIESEIVRLEQHLWRLEPTP